MAARWYVVNVYSGFEKKVAETIHEQAKKKGLESRIEQILVPTEDVVEIKRGEKVTSEKQFFPGYVLVKMEMNDDIWHLVKNVPKVTDFLGAKGKPTPVSEAEVRKIMKQVEDGVGRPKSAASFEIGEQVRVCDGPFTSFSGIVEEVEPEKARLKVSVLIFGRATPVDLEFTQVEKI